MPVAFVSYARADLGFVRTLTEALRQEPDHEVAWDRDEDRTTVRPASVWWDEITAAIQASDKFIFVISPASLASQTCRQELDYAASLHKQVIPVLRRYQAPGQQILPDLKRIDWIFFDLDAAFDAQLQLLIRALDTDLEKSARHARLLVRTAEWYSSKRRRRSQLLRGQELKAYEAILDQAVSDQPDSPTEEQRVYVAASRRWRRARRSFLVAGVAILAGVGYFTAVQFGQRGNQALAGSLATAADQAAPTDPSAAVLLEVAANEADATPDSKTRLLSTSTEPLSSKLTGPAKPVSSVAVSPGGTILAAGNSDGTTWLWNLADPAHPAPLGQPLTGPAGSIDTVAFTPDGTTLAAGGMNGLTQLWGLDVGAAIARICATTGNALTAPQWSQDLPHVRYTPPCAHPGHYGLLTP